MIEARNFPKTLCQVGSCYFHPKFSLHHMRKCERNTPSVEKDLLKEISLSHKIEFRCEYVWKFLSSPKKPGLCLTKKKNFKKHVSQQDKTNRGILWIKFWTSKTCRHVGIKFKGQFNAKRWSGRNFASDCGGLLGGKPQAISPGSRLRRIDFGMLWGRYFAMLWV